jgi:hypothetical protein
MALWQSGGLQKGIHQSLVMNVLRVATKSRARITNTRNSEVLFLAKWNLAAGKRNSSTCSGRRTYAFFRAGSSNCRYLTSKTSLPFWP